MDVALAIAGAVILGVLAYIAVTQRQRIKGIEAKVGLDGVGLSIELHEMVKREVARISLASLSRLARVDRELIGYWEKDNLLQSEESAKRLELIETEVSFLEQKLASAAPEDRYHLAAQLRELYWKYLHHARAHWASSSGYQIIRVRVIEGLGRIEALGSEIVA